MKAGDLIAAVNGTTVWTFADLQYFYDKTPRTAKHAQFTVERDAKPLNLAVTLPVRWWYTDIRFLRRPLTPASSSTPAP